MILQLKVTLESIRNSCEVLVTFKPFLPSQDSKKGVRFLLIPPGLVNDHTFLCWNWIGNVIKESREIVFFFPISAELSSDIKRYHREMSSGHGAKLSSTAKFICPNCKSYLSIL